MFYNWSYDHGLLFTYFKLTFFFLSQFFLPFIKANKYLLLAIFFDFIIESSYVNYPIVIIDVEKVGLLTIV